MKLTPDFCVIGGGIAGLTTARKLAASGGSVVLVEAARIGRGAGFAAAGMLAPLVEARLAESDIARFGFEALHYYPGFVAAVEEESGQGVDYRKEGTLIVGIDRDNLEHIRHLHDEQRALGLPVEWLSGYECRQIEPYLASGIPGGLFSPQDHQVDNRLLLGALVESLKRQANVTLIEEAGEGEFDGTAPGVRPTYRTAEHQISAGHYVIATGARTGVLKHLLPDLARMIRPVKGQIMRLDQRSMPLLSHVIRTPQMYLAPKSSGELVLGASGEDKGFDESITAGVIFELLRAAWECLPGIYELPLVESMVGFRPATIDHEPIIGDSGIEGVWLAMGYFRHGLLFSPYAAEIVADAIVSGRENEWLAKFSPERFNAVDHQR
jgi:glycine oxidase